VSHFDRSDETTTIDAHSGEWRTQTVLRPVHGGRCAHDPPLDRIGGSPFSVDPQAKDTVMPPDLSAKGNPLGPIGTKVLFENDMIRVWDITLGPKGHQPLHQHHHPYLVVPLTEGKAMMRWEDGTTRELNDVIGTVIWRGDPGLPHELFNLGDAESKSILVEMKAGAKPV
jgi:hypothetical protein